MKKYYAAILILVLFSDVFGSNHLQIIKSDEKSIVFSLKPFDLSFRDISVQGERCVQINDNQLTGIPGHPQLPLLATIIGLPGNSRPLLRVLEANFVDLNDVDLSPAPMLHYIPTANGGFMEERYKKNAAAYKVSDFKPSTPAVIADIQIFRSVRLAKIEIYPVLYNPAGKMLRHFKHLIIEVVFNDSETSLTGQSAVSDGDRFFKGVLKKLIPNSASLRFPEMPLVEQTHFTQKDPWYHSVKPYYKIVVSRDGIYHLNYSDLTGAGMSPDAVSPQTIQLFNKGVEIPVFVSGEADGSFDTEDYIEFYGERNGGGEDYYDEYTDDNVYWLTYGDDAGTRYGLRNGEGDGFDELIAFTRKIHFEKDLRYYHGDDGFSIIDTERVPGEGWIWNLFYEGDVRSYDFNIPDVNIENSDLCTLYVKLRGSTLDSANPDHHAIFKLNNFGIGDIFFSDRDEIIYPVAFTNDLLRNGMNVFTIQSGETAAEINAFYFDWAELVYHADTRSMQSELSIHQDENVNARLSLWNLSSDTLAVYNITNGYKVEEYEAANEQRFILKIVSAGFDDGNISDIVINSEYALRGGYRGHNIVVFDSSKGLVEESRWFDTLESEANSDSMAAFIYRIPDGRVVLVSIRDEGSYMMTETAHAALESLGSAQTREVKFRDSWALIGRKGAAPGSVPEIRSPQFGGKAVLRDTLYTTHLSGVHITFQDQLLAGDDLYISEKENLKKPVRISVDQFADLKNSENGADYIFITHLNFRDCADQFAAHWSNSGLRTKVVDIEDIYDEFNDGIKNPEAIRRFLTYSYENWSGAAPSFVLLIGDASWDPKKNAPASIKEDFIPVMGNPVTDNLYVCFQGPEDILPDMFIGRLAIETNAAGLQILEKTKRYAQSPSAEWKKKLLFINGGFDDGEQETFGRQTDRIIGKYVVPPPAACVPEIISKELDGLYEGEKREDINRAFNAGNLWVNFIGHGGSGTWELMFHDEQVFLLENGGRLPFVTSFTCHTGRFANPEITNFGENFVNLNDAGAIGFMGSSGWGFIAEDEKFAAKLFETVFTDTVHELGKAIALSKIKLWGGESRNVQTKSIIYQYSLLGDPAVDLALPDQPDLLLKQDALTWSPYAPVEADSSVEVTVRAYNYGLAAPDSVSFLLNDDSQLHGTNSVYQGKLNAVGFVDSARLSWKVAGLAGQHTLELGIDPYDEIAEYDEDNNSASFSLYIGASRLSISRPGDHQIVTQNPPVLQINNPSVVSGSYYFELDTSAAFNSAFRIQSPQVEQGVLVTRWRPPQLQTGALYFWRIRSAGDNSWVNSSFRVGERFGWQQDIKTGFSDDVFLNTRLSSEGVGLIQNNIIFRVESSAYDDLNYAVIFVNSTPVATSKRGHNIAVCDSYGSFLEFENFDTHSSPADVNEMVQFLEKISDGHYVLVGIRDSGVQSMTEAAYQALESIGSQYCRDVAFRDSWAIIGRKGALPGSVPESIVKQFNGVAIAADTLNMSHASGSVVSPPIGPSAAWQSLQWESDVPASADSVKLTLIGFSSATSNWDTLKTDLINASGESLADISAADYPLMKLKADLSTEDPFVSPELRNWSLFYDPVGDAALGAAVVRVSADTIYEGGSVDIEVDVHNAGIADMDSLVLRFYDQNAETGKTAFSENMLLDLRTEQSQTVKAAWESRGKSGANQIIIEADPDRRVPELSDENNFYAVQVFVLADTMGPHISITFDGVENYDGAMISREPVIDIRIMDGGLVPIQGDSTKADLMLDGRRVRFFANDDVLTFLPLSMNASSNITGLLRYTPQLSDGEHVLELYVRDASGNLTYERYLFRVIGYLELRDVLNYPNPFEQRTNFTYFLTQPADNVTIKVYTVAGRLIRQMDGCPGIAGFNNFEWNGRDADDDRLANGVYFYKIIARAGGEQTEVLEKLVVMR